MEITETQLATLKKYISVLFSQGMGDNNYTPSITTLLNVSDKDNGWDRTGTATIEIMSDSYVTQAEYRIGKILFEIESFKFNNRDLDAEYNQFLLNLDIEISRCENNLLELETPKDFKRYANKNKTFIARLKRENKRIIKYIKTLKK